MLELSKARHSRSVSFSCCLKFAQSNVAGFEPSSHCCTLYAWDLCKKCGFAHGKFGMCSVFGGDWFILCSASQLNNCFSSTIFFDKLLQFRQSETEPMARRVTHRWNNCCKISIVWSAVMPWQQTSTSLAMKSSGYPTFFDKKIFGVFNECLTENLNIEYEIYSVCEWRLQPGSGRCCPI